MALKIKKSPKPVNSKGKKSSSTKKPVQESRSQKELKLPDAGQNSEKQDSLDVAQMGLKVKKSPKPVNSKAKKSSSAQKPEQESRSQKELKLPDADQNSEKQDSNQVSEARLNELLRNNTSSRCQLERNQVKKAVEASFQAFSVSQQKETQKKLFEDDPEPIKLIVSAIKIPQGDPHHLKVVLPHTHLQNEPDICLIVKDLQKGWRVDHEPTIHFYQDLFGKLGITGITEIMPLRQLRVEYKPFEAKFKLAKRFDIFLVDKRIINHVPRYFGKSFYQSGKFPVTVNLETQDIQKEIQKGLSTSLMSVSTNGTSTQIIVGNTNQTVDQVTDNVMSVYEVISKQFPGNFENIRSLTLRFGNSTWTVPIYISLATQDTVKLPPSKRRNEPVIDELSTLAPGWKVAVYPSGEVKKIRDKNFNKSKVDKELADSDIEVSEDETKNDLPAKKRKKSSDSAETQDTKTNPKLKSSSKSLEIDSSDDEGNKLEEEYMEELDKLEEEIGNNDAYAGRENDQEKPTAKLTKKPTKKRKQVLTKK